MNKVSEYTYKEIKQAQKDGHSSKKVEEVFNIPSGEVVDIFSSISYLNYSGKRPASEVVNPAKAGYYKALIARKEEENENLKEHRGWLMEQVTFLKRAVQFLEIRKGELEDGIMEMEKQIIGGVEMIEQMDETENFQQLSEKIKQKNK